MDRQSSSPLWSQLQDDLLLRVRRGEFDQTFPGEYALVTQYGVSRHTVRQALAQLRADRIVIAERGRPPRLAPRDPDPPIAQPLGAVYSLFTSVEKVGLEQRSSVRRLVRIADGVVATRLGLEESTPLLHLERLRYAGTDPLALDRVWLPFDETEALVGADLSRAALYEELATRVGLRVDGGRERIHARNASAGQARLLEVDPGAAIFAIERLGTAADRPVEWRQTIVRGDRFTLSASFGAATEDPRPAHRPDGRGAPSGAGRGRTTSATLAAYDGVSSGH